MTTKNRRAVGTVGLAAVVAVLAVSMIAMNFTAQPAAADHIAAKKAGGYYGTVGVSVMTQGDTVNEHFPIAEFYIKSQDKGDWIVDMAMECATANQVESKGKKDNLEGSKASVQAYIVVDDIVQDNIVWNVCSQDLQLKTTLNDLIDRCTQDDIDDGKCDQIGEPFFVCDLDDPNINTTECTQAIEIYLKSAGAYNVKWFLTNLDAGVHEVEIFAILQAERTSGGFNLADEVIPLSEDQKIISAAFVDQVLVYAEPIHMMNDAYLE